MNKANNPKKKSLLFAIVTLALVPGSSVWTFAQVQPSGNRVMAGNAFVATPGEEDGYPKPDFSALEKYYEVLKYEYDFTPNMPRFNLVVKAKTDKAPKWWIVKWLDGDGVSINNGPMLISPPNDAAMDDPIRADCYSPWKREMPKVKRIVVVQNPNK